MTILDKTLTARRGSVGCLPPFLEMRICDEKGQDLPPGQVGEIVGRGPILMPGYYQRPDLTAQAIVDGWLHTGDLGHADEDGFLYLVDRKKDLIISGGESVNGIRLHYLDRAGGEPPIVMLPPGSSRCRSTG